MRQEEIKPRATLPNRIKWTGNILDFDKYVDQVVGHYTQQNCGYLFMESFHRLYMLHGTKCYVQFSAFVMSERRMEADVVSLYGALISSIIGSAGKSILLKYKKEADGVHGLAKIIRKVPGRRRFENKDHES